MTGCLQCSIMVGPKKLGLDEGMTTFELKFGLSTSKCIYHQLEMPGSQQYVNTVKSRCFMLFSKHIAPSRTETQRLPAGTEVAI